MRHLVQDTVLFPLDILEVADQVAFHALPPREGALDKQGHLTREDRLGARFGGKIAFERPLMQLDALFERELQALQAVVGVGILRFAAAVPHVNLFVAVQDEEIDRVVPIAVEQADIHVVHSRHANTDVLA